MRSTRALVTGIAVGLCLALVGALAGCTNAADWRTAQTGASASTRGYDTSGIRPQDDIIAMLPEGAPGRRSPRRRRRHRLPSRRVPGPRRHRDRLRRGPDQGHRGRPGRRLRHPHGRVRLHHRLDRSKYDAGISSFTVTPERTAEVDMTAYINVGSRFNVQAGNPKGVETSDHLKLCGRTIGVQVGTAQETTMRDAADKCAQAASRCCPYAPTPSSPRPPPALWAAPSTPPTRTPPWPATPSS